MLKKLFLVIALCGAFLPTFAISGVLQYQGAWESGQFYAQSPLLHTDQLLLPAVGYNSQLCVLVAESQLNVNESPNAQPNVWNCGQ